MKKKLNKLGVENSLWNNIRAKKGSGKKPTKEMLKQEANIKKEEAMKKSKSYKKGGSSFLEESKEVEFGYPSMPKAKMMGGKKSLYKKGGFPDLNKDGKTTFADVLEGRGVNKKKAGGEKSMEPGGGGRFAKMVSKLKGKGKSEESAKAIAASVGRKKYGKSKFQEMAAKGRARKKEEGGFEDDEMEVEIEMNMPLDKGKKKKKKTNASTAARKRGMKARKNQQRGRTGCYSGNCLEGVEGL